LDSAYYLDKVNYPILYSLRKRYKNFKQNKVFNEQMRKLKMEGEKFYRKRLLDPKQPNSVYKEFYHSRIVEEFDIHYQKV